MHEEFDNLYIEEQRSLYITTFMGKMDMLLEERVKVLTTTLESGRRSRNCCDKINMIIVESYIRE